MPRSAEALDADLDADRRAWHLGAAATGPDEHIARLLEVSAERARQRGGASAAALLLWRSAELTPDPQRATGRLLEAARAELVGGRGPRAQEILDRARATGLAAQHHAEVAWTEALIHMVAGDVRQAAAVMPEALPLIAADQPELGVGACVAAVAAALTGGHLIQRPTRHAIAAGRATSPHVAICRSRSPRWWRALPTCCPKNAAPPTRHSAWR